LLFDFIILFGFQRREEEIEKMKREEMRVVPFGPRFVIAMKHKRLSEMMMN